jgi:predicted nuclease with TOPRIM domain
MTVNEKKELVNALLNTRTACPELREAAKNYLDALGTEDEKQAAQSLIAELEEDVNSIDDTIAFFSSDKARAMLGEMYKKLLDEALAAKANGETVCTCDGCRAGWAILEKKDEFLK